MFASYSNFKGKTNHKLTVSSHIFFNTRQ